MAQKVAKHAGRAKRVATAVEERKNCWEEEGKNR